MSFCLLSDSWIPVLRNGKIVTIRPDQIAEPGVIRLAWQRADFNIACLELLIGLVSMADPPKDETDWLARLKKPDADRLHKALGRFAPHFVLTGDGPRFLQDLEAFEKAEGSDIKSVDMLCIDSAGAQTVSNNADLMVKRNRFTSLPFAEAAIALYTLQAFAPSGGMGNRTSMRGGGPMTTLVHPHDNEGERFPLWRLVFANVLLGSPLSSGDAREALPWLRPTRTSENSQTVTREDSHMLEAFFGMPRRLRLVFEDEQVVGVVQRPYGTNYEAWEHPLTPYYRPKEDVPGWLPVHPKAGRLSYRNWLGITMEPGGDGKGVRRTARTVRECRNRFQSPDSPGFELMVGGWVMDNMKPVDFAIDTCPGFPGLDEACEDRVRPLVEAAITASNALRMALKSACQLDGTSLDTEIEAFFAETEGGFKESVRRIMDGAGSNVEVEWNTTLKNQAIRMFEQRILGGLTDHNIAGIEKKMVARRNLFAALKKIQDKMGLPTDGNKK